MPIFTLSVISFASAGAVGFGQNRPVTGSIRNCPSRMRNTAATSAIRRIRRHDAGRFNPIADQLPSRSRIEINPSTERTITSFGTMWKTLCPITMKAPKQNSNALSARDARGLPEGNGITGRYKDLKTILSSVGEMRSCSRGQVSPGKRMRTAPAQAEVNALGYSNAPDAGRCQ